MAPQPATGPLHGIRVTEANLGVTLAGAGLAASLPGSILRDLGADVTSIRSSHRPAIDKGIRCGEAWDRGKRVIETDSEALAGTVSEHAGHADILFLAGPEERTERHGLAYQDLSKANPRLIVSRIRPSVTEKGPVPDFELLVAARAGLLTQIRAHRQGRPAANDLPIGQAGAALSAAVGALALLYQREATEHGGWAETSLYDGIAALLPMIIGTVERHSPTTRLLWQDQGPSEALSYRCADGEYVQLWFGAKGAFEAFLEHVGDPPSEQGYNAELAGDGMRIRGERWAAMFAARDRDWWLKGLAGQKFRCEPVLRPGEALRDPHVRETGLAVTGGEKTFLGPPVTVIPAAGGSTAGTSERPGKAGRGNLLDGVRVLDLSAYLAGPVAPLILGELGADVVKIEPPGGDVHRNMEPMFAAGQRGKRAVALDLKSPEAPERLAKAFRWADVVHHNSRVGLAERLGYDERAVRRANPDAVYSFASGFGEWGPKAALPANDQLMQAFAGIEAGQGGDGRPPAYLVWGAVDVTGGWLAACGILAALYARRRTGAGQKVASSLLGAALTLKSGAFLDGDRVVSGPVLDADQSGYGPAYRLYETADGTWLALAITQDREWRGLRSLVKLPGLPDSIPFVRTAYGDSIPEERLLEEAFRARPAGDWVRDLRAAGIAVEPVAELDRTAFAAGFTEDPVNHQRGRVVSYPWGEHGVTKQPCFPPAIGPVPRPRPPMSGIPALGEHTEEFLGLAGFSAFAARDRGTAVPPGFRAEHGAGRRGRQGGADEDGGAQEHGGGGVAGDRQGEDRQAETGHEALQGDDRDPGTVAAAADDPDAQEDRGAGESDERGVGGGQEGRLRRSVVPGQRGRHGHQHAEQGDAADAALEVQHDAGVADGVGYRRAERCGGSHGHGLYPGKIRVLGKRRFPRRRSRIRERRSPPVR